MIIYILKIKIGENRKLKIAFIGTEGIPGNYGGFETFVDNVSYRLTKEGHYVTVFQPGDYIVNLRKTKYADINLEYILAPKNKYLRAIIKRIDAFRKTNSKYDIIHNFGPYPFINKLFKVKSTIAATIDGFEWKRASYNKILRYYMKKNYKYCGLFPDIPIVDSKVVHNYFTSLNIKTYYLPYGTNFLEQIPELFDKFKKIGLEKDGYVYFVGRFVIEKNIHRLISDFKKIKSSKKLILIGKGNIGESYESFLRNIASNDKRIIFTGALYGNDYYNIISNSSGYISTSKLEGTSPALLDALGAKRKVLVSDIVENQATLNNLGKYFPLHNYKKSPCILEKFLNDELYLQNDYSSLISYAKENFNWNSIVYQYTKILSDFLENK